MASRNVSPGGALLRASRMFSIPPPLPRPSMNSETATSPYPLHLSVTTPYASLQRGDWGFKRSLPLRSTTRTSTPLIRVQAIDTIEHVTDFRSSADHALSLQKWQELDVPLTVTPDKTTQNPHNDVPIKSVFEDEIDRTTDTDNNFSTSDLKWKFKGPWLAGQSEGEFADYLKKDIRQQKAEFRVFLRARCAAALTKDARQESLAEGQDPIVIRPEDVTEVQLNDYTKRIRKDRKDLYTHIHDFLDLAPISDKDGTSTMFELDKYIHDILSTSGPSVFESQLKDLPASLSPYRLNGPPKTHPSAGLSYSRSAARTFNHPEHGPQAHKAPIEGRIVLPRIGHRTKPTIGVGGFVANVPNENTNFRFAKGAKTIPGLNGVEPDKVGGSKTWVQPRSASIDSEGRVKLVVAHSDEAAVAVKQGTTAASPSKRYYKPAGGFQLPQAARSGNGGKLGPRASTYGLGSASELDGLLSTNN